MWAVYRSMYDYVKVHQVFDTEEEARCYCEDYGWEYNLDGIWYDLSYDKL